MDKSSHVFKICRLSEGKIQDSFLVEQKQILIGRNTEAEVPVTDLSVSRRHLVITFENDQIFLEDQKTPGGTRVAGEALPPHRPTPYNPGDAIQLGKCDDTFIIDIFHNHLTDAQLASEVAKAATQEAENLTREAKVSFEKTLERAKVEAEEVIAHARLEAAEIQKKAHFELLKIQQSAATEEAKILEKIQLDAESQRKAIAEQVQKEKGELLARAQRNAETEFQKSIEQKSSDWESHKSRELEKLKNELTKEMELKVASELKALKKTHSSEISKAESTLESLKKQIQKYSDEAQQNQKELAEKRAEAEKIKDQLQKDQKHCQDLHQQLKKEQQDLEKAHKDTSEAKKKLSSLEKELKKSAESQKSLEKLSNQRDKLTTAIKELEAQLETMRVEKLTQLEAQLEKEQRKFKKTLPKKARTAVKGILKSLRKSWASAENFSGLEKELKTDLAKIIESLFLDEPLQMEEDTGSYDQPQENSMPPEHAAVIELEAFEPEHESGSTEMAEVTEITEITEVSEVSELEAALSDQDESDSPAHESSGERSHSPWKWRIAIGLLLASLIGTAYLLRENIRAFGTASSSSESEFEESNEDQDMDSVEFLLEEGP